MSEDMLLGVMLAAIAATAEAAAMYIAYEKKGQANNKAGVDPYLMYIAYDDLLKKGQANNKGNIDSCLAVCSCEPLNSQRNDYKWNPCKRHDQELLFEISRVISSYDFMQGLGIYLGIKTENIEAFLENNRNSINRAAFVMLHQWYTEHGELKVAELQSALNKVHRGHYNKKIIDRHFEERRQRCLNT